MPQQSDISITVRFTGADNFPTALISGLINTVEKVVFQFEQEQLEHLIKQNRDIPLVVADASRHRIYAHKGQSVLIESASHGCIELAFVVTALAYWILDKTLGETLKQAWQKSPMNVRLKEILSEDRTRKAKEIARRLEQRVDRSHGLKELSVSTKIDVSEGDGISNIQITVTAKKDAELPPTRGEILLPMRDKILSKDVEE